MKYQRSELMQQRLAENRSRILLAARRLVASGGFRAASVTAVARNAGLSTGALYRYFPSKSELLVEVLTDAVSNEVAILKEIIERPETATQRLRAAVRSFATRALEGRQLAYAFIAEPTDPEVEAARILCREDFGEVFKSILRAGIDNNEFRKQSVDVSAACIVGAFTEALVRPVASTSQRSGADTELAQSIEDFCLYAVAGAKF